MKLAGRSTPEAGPAAAITGGGYEMGQGGFLSLVLDCGRQRQDRRSLPAVDQ